MMATAVHAAPLSGNFAINVWYGTNPTSTHASGDPAEQALPTNPLVIPANLLYSGTYSGAILFSDRSSGNSGNILSFLRSAGGTLTTPTTTLNHLMSQGSFQDATLIEITSFADSPVFEGSAHCLSMSWTERSSLHQLTRATAAVAILGGGWGGNWSLSWRIRS